MKNALLANAILAIAVGAVTQGDLMKYAYIIGPYGANEALGRTEKQNTLVAEYLAAKAYDQGYVPFVPHSMIYSGIFGDDSNPEDRAKGERATLALMSAFMKQPNCELWVIGDYIYNSWLFSSGTSKELKLWKKKKGFENIKYFLYPALDSERRNKDAQDLAH